MGQDSASDAGPARESDSLDARWSAFHRLFLASGGWITLSHVGVSGDGTQAVASVSHVAGGEAGAGLLVLLEKEHGVWRVRKTVLTWVA